jgi:hypothetical protein
MSCKAQNQLIGSPLLMAMQVPNWKEIVWTMLCDQQILIDKPQTLQRQRVILWSVYNFCVNRFEKSYKK